MAKSFVGLCGLVNYCARPKLLGLRPVTLLIQQTAPASPADRRAFRRALSLTRLILHDLKATLEAKRFLCEVGSAAILTVCSLGIVPDREVGETNAAGTNIPEAHATSAFTTRTDIPWTCAKPAGGNHHCKQLVQQMLDYIQKHYSQPMQLGDLAAAVNLNAAYVSSLFSTTTGVTFHHYLEELRLAKAKDLLRDPLKRVCEVAYAVGYPNPNHFRNVFRARVGVSPSAWRETTEAGT